MYHEVKTRAHKKRKMHQGRHAVETQLGVEKRKNVNKRGGGVKTKLVNAKHANVLIDDKNVKCEVVNVSDNPASKDFARRNIITKGSVVDVKTPDGKTLQARVRSKPGSDGVLNAVKIK
ncbi:MAG: 30S ribosomal protein S8e [Candidatus Altiarchaeota archaeon]